MIVVRETEKGKFEPISGNPTLTSLDGKRRAPLKTILAQSWSAEDRAAFGIYLAEPMQIPEGKRSVGDARFEKQGSKVVEVYDLEDAPPAPLPPLTARQIRLALFNAGKLEAVEQAVQQIGGAVSIEWEYATVFERDNSHIEAVAALLEMSSQEIDALWQAGLKL